MKRCSECNLEKDETAFYRAPCYKNGIMSICKECKKNQGAGYRKLNAEKRNSKRRQYYLDNKESCQLKCAEWYKSNIKYAKFKNSEWKRLNPDRHCAAQAKRHAKKLHATPPWLTKNQLQEIQWFYSTAKELQWLSDPTDPLEVDHMVPLQGKNVSGLHVPWNLQILPKSLNLIKSNK
jgi:hypothetical protein